MKFFSTFSQKYLEVIKKAVSLQRFKEIEHIKLNEQMKGRLAQLVQSICLTSRGSAVRIRQRPLQEFHPFRWNSFFMFFLLNLFFEVVVLSIIA